MNHFGFALEGNKIIDNPGVVKVIHFDYWLINDDFNPLGFDSFHDALNA
jgi:hypothetical protein